VKQRLRPAGAADGEEERIGVVIMKLAALICLISIIFTSLPSLCPGAQPQPQPAPVRTRGIEVGYVRNNSGERVDDVGGSAARDKWGRIQVDFDTYLEYIDQLEIRYFLLMKNRRTMLTGSQTCMYVRKGNSHLTSIYVYPNAVEKYGGEIIGVAVEYYIEGQLALRSVIGEQTGRWWDRMPATTGALTNWHATPFRRTGAHKFEALKLE